MIGAGGFAAVLFSFLINAPNQSLSFHRSNGTRIIFLDHRRSIRSELESLQIPKLDSLSAPSFLASLVSFSHFPHALHIPALRLLLVAHKLKSLDEAKFDARKMSDKEVVVKLLVHHLKLPKRRPQAKKLQKDQTVLNVSRGISTAILLMRA